MPGRRVAEHRAIAVTAISGKIDIAARRGHRETAPQRAVAVAHPARRPVLDPFDIHLDAGLDADAVAPVAGKGGDAAPRHQGGIAERRDNHRTVPSPQPLKRVQIEMVIMIVADQHDVDFRQILKPDARCTHPLGTGPTDWTDPL